MNKPARISVITPSYNQAEFIEKTILSVLRQQTDADVEHIVVDGASTDGTLDILNKYPGKVRWVSSHDRGQSDAVNKGIIMATGDIIGWLNSDDVYLPGALQKVMRHFDFYPECQWLYGQCNIIDVEDREIRRWVTKYKNFRIRKFNDRSLLLENCISQPAVFFRKSAFLAAGPLSLDLPFAMDYDLWFRFARQSWPGIIHDILASFRVHGNSKGNRNTREQFMEQYDIHKRHDQRRLFLFLHRAFVYATIFGYRMMSTGKSVPLVAADH